MHYDYRKGPTSFVYMNNDKVNTNVNNGKCLYLGIEHPPGPSEE